MAEYVQIDPNEVYLKWLGGSEIITLNIESSRIGRGWEIDITHDLWCEIQIGERYSNNTYLLITAPQNPEPAIRTIELEIMFDNEVVGNLYIEQEAGEEIDYIYSVNPTSLSYTNAGGSKEVTLSTNSPYSWKLQSTPTWITSTIKGGVLTATATANDLYVERTGSIIINCGYDFVETISVTQEPLGKRDYNITPTEIIADGTGGTHTIRCTSNGNATWKILNRPESFIHYDWISITGGDVVLTLTFDENTYDRQQFGSIIISADNGAYEATINVTQKAKSEVNISPTSFDIDKNAQTIYATASTNYDASWVITSNNDWITAIAYESSYGKYEWYFKISVVAYDGEEPRMGSVSVTNGNGETYTIPIIQNGVPPTPSNEYWSIPPMFMDGTDSIYYFDTNGESTSDENIKINRNSGINNHALTSTPYYDSDIRLCFADKENKPIDGSDVLVFYNNRKYFTDDFRERYLVNLTDDVPEMLELNDGESCWICSLTDTNVNGDKIAIQVLDYPQFSRYIANGYNVSKNFDLGNPVEEYSMNYNLEEDTDIYGQYWKKYLTDQYSRNTRILECYVRIPYGLMQDYLRNFFYFDNSYWILIEVVDYNLTKEQSCKCKFIKVNDTNNYTNGQII